MAKRQKLTESQRLKKKYPKKSRGAKKVLQLMDQDYTYGRALSKALRDDKRLSKKRLEEELNRYI